MQSSVCSKMQTSSLNSTEYTLTVLNNKTNVQLRDRHPASNLIMPVTAQLRDLSCKFEQMSARAGVIPALFIAYSIQSNSRLDSSLWQLSNWIARGSAVIFISLEQVYRFNPVHSSFPLRSSYFVPRLPLFNMFVH